MTSKTAKTRQLADGSIEALSSDGHTVYHVRIGVLRSCTCPAGRKNIRCYHVKSAEAKYPGFWPVFRKPARRAQVSDLYA